MKAKTLIFGIVAVYMLCFGLMLYVKLWGDPTMPWAAVPLFAFVGVGCTAMVYTAVGQLRRTRPVRRTQEGIGPRDFYLFDPPPMPTPRISYPRYDNDGEGFKDDG